MKKKIIAMLLVAMVSLSLIGCRGGKIINNSIVTNAKINDMNLYGFKNACYKVSTDKGEFYITNNEYSSQLDDLCNLKKNTGKDLVVDIIYYNNDKNSDNLYEINEVVVIE